MKKPFALLWILFGGLLVFSWVYLPTLSKYRDLKLQQDELDTQIEKLTHDIQEIQEERDLLKNDVEYLEKVIRGELGLVKPGEIVYKFVKDEPKAKEPEVPVQPPAETPKPAEPAVSKPAVPAGETFVAKPVTAVKPKTAVIPVPIKPKTAAAAVKPKTLPSANQEPVYPRRETR